ncbi:hypothetical protein Y032_0044g1009 [Ancylostoma ceylanicum]|uniref:Uncharacterized protein n=1 Tax=Ancylostoma ceylanicum TaxID=53326 RepID=A0A016UE15_9BILA|nr:hypothetical protein Y032_0044g1009 [Ancylostoma ceylanicum]
MSLVHEAECYKRNPTDRIGLRCAINAATGSLCGHLGACVVWCKVEKTPNMPPEIPRFPSKVSKLAHVGPTSSQWWPLHFPMVDMPNINHGVTVGSPRYESSKLFLCGHITDITTHHQRELTESSQILPMGVTWDVDHEYRIHFVP